MGYYNYKQYFRRRYFWVKIKDTFELKEKLEKLKEELNIDIVKPKPAKRTYILEKMVN